MPNAASPSLYWLDGADGRVLLRRGSLLIGRSPDCDVVIPDATVSRHHALLRVTDGGVDLVPLGRTPVQVNGSPCGAMTPLREGDEVSVCGHTFRLVVTAAPPGPEPEVAWAITRSGATHHRVKDGPFTVGGAADDDLFIEGWVPAALTFTVVQRSLVLEASVAGVRCGHALEEGEVVTVLPGARITLGDQELRALALGTDLQPATAPLATPQLPGRATLLFHPKGGRLTLGFGAREHTAWLAERRCDLVAALLKPHGAYAPGDVFPDEVLFRRVWPGGEPGRTELNTLVFRARKDLVKAGLDGGTLIERQPGGVCFRLAARAHVRVDMA
jgi:hypothetical protein